MMVAYDQNSVGHDRETEEVGIFPIEAVIEYFRENKSERDLKIAIQAKEYIDALWGLG
jgi:hypothetical protein